MTRTILRRFVEIALSKKEELASLLSRETGKPIREARAEIGNIPALFDGFVERRSTCTARSFPKERSRNRSDAPITVREPMGVVACVIPFNFPVNLSDRRSPRRSSRAMRPS